MWKKKFYAVFWDGKGVDLRRCSPQHLEYMIEIENDRERCSAPARSISARPATA